METRKLKIFHNRTLFLLSIFLAFVLGILFGNIKSEKAKGNLFGQEPTIDENYFRYYNMFRQAFKLLQEEYVDKGKTDSKTLLSGAIKGMLQATEDPYTDFLSPEIAEEFAANINASFYGVGIRIEMRNNVLTVVAPIKGTPAARAGLQPGDKILAIDGESTEGITSLEAVGKIRGKIGTDVVLTIAHPGAMNTVDVTLKRAKIDIDTVESAVIPFDGKKIGYIKIIEFGNPTVEEFQKALQQVLAQDPQALILDVRNNPGGLLTGVAHIADTLLEEGLIVYTRGRIEGENFEFKASKNKTLVNPNMPIIVLGNQGSASASEILIGALKDTKRATVLGKNTFGKGCVQKTFPLSDGSLLKYTIAKYYTPAGNSIAKIGIAPDIEENMWYDDLSETQRISVIQLQTTNLISEFVEKYPNPTEQDYQELTKEVTNIGIILPEDVVKKVVLQRKSSTLDEVYNLELDNQLEKALELTKNLDAIKPKTMYIQKTKTVEELQKIEQERIEKVKEKEKKNKEK